MAVCVDRHLEKGRRYRVLDLGSRVSLQQTLTHRQLLEGYDVDYTGVDIRPGRNVDIVMERPYRIPVRSGTVDVVLSGQAFEHIAFPWASILEVARVLRSGGLAMITAPSRGHPHGPYDAWRYYPDGLRALAAWARLEMLEVHTDFPPVLGGTGRGRRKHDYGRVEPRGPYYWGDSIGVFRKRARRRSLVVALVRPPVLWWANRVRGPQRPPAAAPDARHEDVLATADRPRQGSANDEPLENR